MPNDIKYEGNASVKVWLSTHSATSSTDDPATKKSRDNRRLILFIIVLFYVLKHSLRILCHLASIFTRVSRTVVSFWIVKIFKQLSVILLPIVNLDRQLWLIVYISLYTLSITVGDWDWQLVMESLIIAWIFWLFKIWRQFWKRKKKLMPNDIKYEGNASKHEIK